MDVGLLSSLREEFSFIRGNFLILVLSWILMDFADEVPRTYYSLYVLELGGTESIIGLIGFVSFIALALVQPPGGYLADRCGRRGLICTMTFGVALSYLLYALAPSWHFILAGALTSSLCLIYQPALMAMVADSLPPERRGMGYSIIMLIASVSTTPAPILAGCLCLRYGLLWGMRVSYLLAVVVFLAAATLRLRLKETVERVEGIRLRELLRVYPTSLGEIIRVWGLIPRSMLFLLLASLFMIFSSALVQPYLVIYAVQDLQISEFDWALLMTLLSGTMLVSALPLGKLIDRVGRKVPLLIAYGLPIPAVWLFLNGGFVGAALSLSLMGVATILGNSAYSSLQADLVPREKRGKVMGFSNFVGHILTSLGQLVGGVMYERISHQLPFLLLAVLSVPALLITLLMVHEPGEREQ